MCDPADVVTVDWRARAEAAERTVEVLKRRVRHLQDGGQSALHRTVERAQERATEVRRRQEVLAIRNEELRRHSERLAAEVAARTYDLQVITDHVVAGFVVVDAEGRVRPGFTRSCHELVAGTIAPGTSIALAFGLTEREADGLLGAMAEVFADVLPEELSLDQVGRRLRGGAGRRLRLDARTIRVGDAVDALLFTLTDVTSLEEAERRANHGQLLVSLLRQRAAFQTFLDDAEGQLGEARTLAAEGDDAETRRILHTLKGNAACFGLTEVVEVAHRLEDQPRVSLAGVVELGDTLADFLRANADVLGAGTMRDSIAVARAEVLDLLAILPEGPVATRMRGWLCRTASAYLAALPAMVERLAERLGKHVELSISGGELPIDPETTGVVIRELGHLVRNAIDHGIEAPRARHPKRETGRVTIAVDEVGDECRIVVTDDGRGIDDAALLAKAGIEAPPDATPGERLALALRAGVSTASAVTDVSGRGVGLAAVQAAVARAGGRLSVSSRAGQGTAFELRVPVHRR